MINTKDKVIAILNKKIDELYEMCGKEYEEQKNSATQMEKMGHLFLSEAYDMSIDVVYEIEEEIRKMEED